MDQRAIDTALAEVVGTELSRFTRAADRRLTAPPTVLGDGLASRNAGRSLEFLDHVPYAAGADARTIDWRASARSQGLLVRRYQNEMTPQWQICVDGSASMGLPDATKWLRVIQMAAAFCYLLLQRGHRVGLISFSDEVDGLLPAWRGRGQFANILKQLSQWRPRARAGGSVLRCCLPHLARRCSTVVLSDFLAPDGLRADLDRLLARGGSVHALQVLAANECALGGAGPVTIADVESGERGTVNAATGPGEATARLQVQQLELDQFCCARRILYTACPTDQSWTSLLANHIGRTGTDA